MDGSSTAAAAATAEAKESDQHCSSAGYCIQQRISPQFTINTHKSCDPRTARQTKCNVSSPRKLPLIRVLCLHGTNVHSDKFTRISVDVFASTESHGMCQKMFYAKIQMITERFVLTPLGHVCFTSTASVLLLLRNHVRLTTKANREEFIAFVQRMLTFCVLHKIRFVFCLICCSCFRLV